ncbi:Rieske (2Fe-2S) protein [Gloeothece verrucosa]|uniref:Rieske (2Fe-2S) iron-sulfur domain protein n=1 Tax=Gloeothece verrucosa (strain PCC 7822) TaxID=497965 RepID=E0U5C4_GLOV7|nr:Rieske (2Fe-2S) protein [Gloeothece verrucosa]ADN13514.1 Rieske (2Fe-2S) iron-sulfur domain protein [Gloeothece verrucosa PCC 7822]
MSWTKVLSVDALAPGQRKIVTVGQQKILLINHNGQLYAVDKACPHLKLSMKNGKITEEGSIICPWHKSSFDLRSGEATDWTPWPPVVGKAMAMVAKPKPLQVFPVRVEEDSIWVEV